MTNLSPNSPRSKQQFSLYTIDQLINTVPRNDHQPHHTRVTSNSPPTLVHDPVALHNNQKRLIPPLMSCDSMIIDSPARSKRGSPSSDPDDDEFRLATHQRKKRHTVQPKRHQHLHSGSSSSNPIQNPTTSASNPTLRSPQPHTLSQPIVSTAAARYAATRFPFPPYIIRFNSNQVMLNQVVNDIVHHFRSTKQIDINILNCRSSKVKCSANETDFLLYLKDASSFASLFDKTVWPTMIASKDYMLPSWPSIPPQLALIIKNVNIQIDTNELFNEVKSLVPEVINVIRMKNKFGNHINMIKLEMSSPTARQSLLDAKRITINHICYEVTEFLSTATVLICSKCCGIGHFRKQCVEMYETCRNCAQTFPDLKCHHCSTEPKCKHCNGNHTSNSLKCPVIKSYRAELSKKILGNNNKPSSNTTSRTLNPSFSYNLSDFPLLPSAQASINNSMTNKLDKLIANVSEVNTHLTSLTKQHDKYEKFINERAAHDERINKQIDAILVNDHDRKKDLLQLHLLVERHENLFLKLLFPIIDDLIKAVSSLNFDKRNHTLDPDLKVRLERYSIQMKKTKDSILCHT